MGWQVFFTTCTMIFLAELGDKTQFAALAASAGTESTMSVMLAVVLALAIAGMIGVIAGRYLGSYVSPQYIKLISGSLFIFIGAWTLISK